VSPYKLKREDGLKVFFISFSDIDGRLDPLYYYSVNNLEIVNNTRYPVKKLSEVIEMQRGRFGHRPRNEPRFYGGEYPFIQTGDIVRASQTNGQITYSQTLNELGLKTSRLFSKPVVVITIAANIGDTAILDYPACFPDSLIGMTHKTNELTLEYINLYFKFIKAYLEDLAPQSAQKNINYQQLSPVPIVVPPLEIQHRAVQIYQTALIQRQQKEQQAQVLLAGIDAYLLAELGITLPQKNNSLDKRIFRVLLSEIAGNRLDPDYSKTAYKNLRDAIRQSRFRVVLLKEITNGVFSGKTPASGDYAEEITPYPIIKVRSYSQESIDLQKTDYTYLPQIHRVQKGDIFILSAAHQPEYVGRHLKYLNEEPSIPTSFVGELICVRANQQCASMYLFSLLSLDIFKTLINRG